MDARQSVAERNVRLGRQISLCLTANRNFAYYRGTLPKNGALKADQFWATLNGNFLEMFILDWCKLFADPSGRHHWTKSVPNQKDFRKALLNSIRLTSPEFEDYIKRIKADRDKFIAHLDDPDAGQNLVRFIPKLTIARRATLVLLARLYELRFDNDAANGIRFARRDYEANRSSAMRAREIYLRAIPE